jgi:plasmid replication initiation protein
MVTKSNDLIEASYRLTTNEQRIILMLAAKVQPEDEEFKRYKIEVTEFAEMLGLKRTGLHSDIQNIVKSLMTKPLRIKKKNSTLDMTWLASAEYFVGQGYVELEFSPKLKTYLLQLKERFTTYRLHNVMQLRSVYSIRIYELLKQYSKVGTRLFELDDLKYTLGIEEGEYEKYGHFKSKVLKVAQKELNEKTDIEFDFVEIKDGRKVAKINFVIRKNGRNDTPELPAAEEDFGIIARLREFGLNEIQIDHAIKTYDESYILENLAIVEQDYKNGKVKNLTGYAYKALEQDYRKNKAQLEKKFEKESAEFNPAAFVASIPSAHRSTIRSVYQLLIEKKKTPEELKRITQEDFIQYALYCIENNLDIETGMPA